MTDLIEHAETLELNSLQFRALRPALGVIEDRRGIDPAVMLDAAGNDETANRYLLRVINSIVSTM